jgi:hypothetical protein
MFIPGGGLIQLFMTAFDMVKFVMNEGSRIASLVQSIVGGVANIARGDVTGAISKVEQSLAKAVPLALSFMSRIFRVSGIGTKIKAIIQKVKGKIDSVVKRLMDKVAGMVAKISGALTGKSKTTGKPDANTQSTTKPGEDKRTLQEKEKAVKDAVSQVTLLIENKDASKESIEANLPSIKDKFKLAQLKLIKAGKKRYSVFAQVNPEFTGPPGILLTLSELKELAKVAGEFAKVIKSKPGAKAKYLANKYDYLRSGQNVKIGDTVEAAAMPPLKDLANLEGLTLVINPALYFVDSSGGQIGGQIAEMDFLMVGDGSLVKVVSAKIAAGSFKPGQDRRLLRHFAEMPLSAPDIITYANTNFGVNKNYSQIDHAIVKSNKGTEKLASFRSKYLSKTVVDTVKVESVTPKPGVEPGYQLRVDDEQLIDVVIRFIDKKL